VNGSRRASAAVGAHPPAAPGWLTGSFQVVSLAWPRSPVPHRAVPPNEPVNAAVTGGRAPRSDTVITSIVMISCETDSIPEVAEAIAELPGVSEV